MIGRSVQPKYSKTQARAVASSFFPDDTPATPTEAEDDET